MTNRAIITAVISVTIAGCAPDRTAGTDAEASDTRFAKGGGTQGTPDSRAILTWDDLAIRSDGNGPYEGGVQGVNARLFYYDINGTASGDLGFDPDASSSSLTRKLIFTFPSGAVATGAEFKLWGLMQLGSTATDSIIYSKYAGTKLPDAYPSATALQPDYPDRAKIHPDFRFKVTGIAGCAELSYAVIRLTRTAGAFVPTTNGMGKWVYEDQPGAWVVESVATEREGQVGHWATCLTTVKRSQVANGTYDMPFRVTVQEVR